MEEEGEVATRVSNEQHLCKLVLLLGHRSLAHQLL